MDIERMAKEIVEDAGRRQKKGEKMDCPVCGDPMRDNLYHNALSRRADVYVCERCGVSEALEDATGRPPMPFQYWDIVGRYLLQEQTGGNQNG